jgi:hypothetical protein
MNQMKLSIILLELGLLSALGTTEFSGDEHRIVRRKKTPNSYNTRNGVLVVYDEEGRPWIARDEQNRELALKLQTLVTEYNLKHGGYVPHSNDGGQFVVGVLPTLSTPCP